MIFLSILGVKLKKFIILKQKKGTACSSPLLPFAFFIFIRSFEPSSGRRICNKR